MASEGDMVDGTKVVSEDLGTLMGGSGSKLEEVFDVNKGVKGFAPAADVDVVVTKRVVETDTVVVESTFDSNNELECGLGDQEKEKSSLAENLSVNVVGEGDASDVKLENQDNSFCVGDFVWGKIKSHPWWPGQIYDEKDASAFAVKHKQEGRVLVAFFGDGSCSWCLPSQLIPFVENFAEMSIDSSAKSFLNAVQKAVDEVGRVMELEMACSCISKEKREGLATKVVKNGGIKAGVIMPKVDVNRLAIPKYEPAEIVAKVKLFAKGAAVDSVLELAVIRSWLSAFCRFRDGHELPQYREAVHIEGLEDQSKNNTMSDVVSDFSGSIDVSSMGPMDEEWAPPAVDTDDIVYQRRKQKSVAELMGENMNVKPERQKRARASGGTGKGKAALKKKKVEISDSSEKALESENDGAEPVNGFKPKDIEVSDAEMASDDEAKEEELEVSSPRERKKSKYLSPPYTDLAWLMRISNSKIKSQIEIGSDKITKTNRSGSEEKLPNGQLADESDTKLSFSTSAVDVSVDELLLNIQSAAVDPFYLSKNGSLDMVSEFVSAFRSSIYLHGPDYKIFRKCISGGKKTKLASQLGNGLTQKRAKSSKMKTPKPIKVDAGKAEEMALPCLTLAFTPGFPLPSKEDIIGHFGKFGVLNENKTEVVEDSNSVNIVYMKDSDAEAAFRTSLTDGPFGFENVNYKLKRSAAGSRSRLSSPNASSLVKQTVSDDLISDVTAVRRKLAVTTAILENYHSKFSAEEKCSLKNEMKHLMETVETTCEKVRAMAENSSA